LACDGRRVAFGDTGILACPLGLGSSYGIGRADVLHAFDRGVNWFYWGSLRRGSFGEGVADLARTHRDEMVVVVQSYTRLGMLLRGSIQRALRSLRVDHADLLLLGMWDRLPPPRILDAAVALRREGLARHVMVSCHRRATFAGYLADPEYAGIMVRYSAAHPGAEQDVFPLLGRRPVGVVAYTATCWGRLVDPTRTPAGEPTPRGSDCYRFALTNPHVDVCLAGPADRAQLDEALSALDRGPMSPDEIAWMKRVGAAVRRLTLHRA
jgi:aryl-alcohol dehydrogenase-like predicted oxidoreductase